ncbi:iron-containing redox enzyme family protein [Corallococcus sp. Z5C101001]|uniref:iron-containing redox enzyme family protein n=1 Tax=Corallococcus sp. Z5C101001 TaxID=2596829 RepID=UPI00117D21A9|nr:iron-containing redox enzyme family protein [Corallococcus sp. Z5C101001]TSC22665.1 iron-containing redox enzyme family protein [Corallococcus sp. Z5C101001]
MCKQPRNEQTTKTDWMDSLRHEARMLVRELDTAPGARRLFEGRIHHDDYVYYLVQTYQYVRWSTEFLTESGERMKREGQNTALADLLLQKSAEEDGHERWLLADLRNLGWTQERVERAPICHAVSAYVEWNRFTTRSGTPTAFLGTAYVLEYLSVNRAPDSVDRLIADSGIANIHKAVTFLRGHGNADGDHVAELESVLRTLTSPEEQAALLMSARMTRAVFPHFFRDR